MPGNFNAMNRRLRRILPIVTAAVIVSGQQLLASGQFKYTSSLAGISETHIFESTVNQNKQRMYVAADTNVLSDVSSVSSSVEKITKGQEVYIVGIDGEMCQILTSSGQTGYVSIRSLTDTADNVFHDADGMYYCTEGTEVRILPDLNATVYETLSQNTQLHVTGVNECGFVRIEIDGGEYYVESADLSETKIYIPKMNTLWNGPVLTPGAGTIIGPSGKETYYNLNMSACVQNAKNAGAEGDYWVREDGVKMLGEYVMVAADFSIRPLCTIVPTSLGMGIVVDTGGFVMNNATQLDIAVAW